MVKIAVVNSEMCSICDHINPELLEVTKEGIFLDSKIYICQSCVSKWFRAFKRDK